MLKNIPFDRLATVCKDIFGILQSAGTLVNMVEECGMSLKDFMAFIKKQLLAASVLHADDYRKISIRMKLWSKFSRNRDGLQNQNPTCGFTCLGDMARPLFVMSTVQPGLPSNPRLLYPDSKDSCMQTGTKTAAINTR